ncbi:MAG: DUF6036 family nucleotidyltransferase [Candidatus Woesearchaeota archaeon]|nr:DUF6036 family nucleotidyltransferase [Candidatus Woesearchaeota archaeon]
MDQKLLLFLEELDAAARHKVPIVALGGNVMVTLGLRNSTADIDVNASSRDSKLLEQVQRDVLIKYGIPSHVLLDGNFITFVISDYWQRATPYETKSLKNVELRLLNLNDVLLCKLDRAEKRDRQDIEKIMENAQIDVNDLKNRFAMYLQLYRYEDRKQAFIQNWEAFCNKYGIK